MYQEFRPGILIPCWETAGRGIFQNKEATCFGLSSWGFGIAVPPPGLPDHIHPRRFPMKRGMTRWPSLPMGHQRPDRNLWCEIITILKETSVELLTHRCVTIHVVHHIIRDHEPHGWRIYPTL